MSKKQVPEDILKHSETQEEAILHAYDILKGVVHSSFAHASAIPEENKEPLPELLQLIGHGVKNPEKGHWEVHICLSDKEFNPDDIGVLYSLDITLRQL